LPQRCSRDIRRRYHTPENAFVPPESLVIFQYLPRYQGLSVSDEGALTPIGHQNNTLILGPGGLRFGDYWRLGLPLDILVVAVSIPALLHFWPL